MQHHTRALLALAAGSLLLSACAVSTRPVIGPRRAYALSWSQEVALGREADAETMDELGVYDDPALTAYVTRVGEAVLAQSHLRRPGARPEFRSTEFTFRVLDTPIVNAFALPGGYVYVTRGLLAHLDNEAQLAVVLGHEIGHVAARHTSRRMHRARGGVPREALWRVGGDLGLLVHGPGDEEESDRLGVEYAARADYRAAEGAGFFRVLVRMREGEDRAPALLSTHPDPGTREENVLRIARQWEARGYEGRQVGRDAFLAALEGMVVGVNPRHGFVEGGTFHHPDQRFSFAVPTGWKVRHEHARVQMADPEGEAAIMFRSCPKHTDARTAAAEYLKEGGIRVIREEEDRPGPTPAYRVEGERVEGKDTTRVLLRFLELGGRVYVFGAAAPAAEHGEVDRLFRDVLESFRPLTDPQVLALQPSRLHVAPVAHPAPLRALLTGAPPRGMTEDGMAILNHLRADDTVPAGTRLKRVK